MWLCLSDAFFSIVNKDCDPGDLLVRARRRGDIEKVFPRSRVTYSTNGDYLARAAIRRGDIYEAMMRELRRIDYPNFKDSVVDQKLHDAYLGVWTEMAKIQPTPPYSGTRRKKGKR